MLYAINDPGRRGYGRILSISRRHDPRFSGRDQGITPDRGYELFP